LMGFYSLLEEHLELPFRTRVLGEEVSVESIQETDAGGIVASCRRGPHRQAISLLELPLPDPPPRGAEWIEAYRRWARG
ncbi:MAG: hypothetical protein HY721_25225, partial [Planctomycetes bacterium]|nr:hypothetical protein [Planctomycetota bacterium]